MSQHPNWNKKKVSVWLVTEHCIFPSWSMQRWLSRMHVWIWLSCCFVMLRLFSNTSLRTRARLYMMYLLIVWSHSTHLWGQFLWWALWRVFYEVLLLLSGHRDPARGLWATNRYSSHRIWKGHKICIFILFLWCFFADIKWKRKIMLKNIIKTHFF